MAGGIKEWSRQNGRKWGRSLLNLLNCAVGRFWTNIEFRPIHKTTKEAPSFLPKGGLLHLKVNVNVHTPPTKGFEIIPLHTTGNSNFFSYFSWKTLTLDIPPLPRNFLHFFYGYWAVRFTRRFFTNWAPSLALIHGETSTLILKLTTSITLTLSSL